MHRPVTGLEERRRVGLPPLLHRRDELPVRGDDHEEDVRDHDRPEHHSNLEIRRARSEELARSPGGERDEHGPHGGEPRLAPSSDRPAEHVVDDPRERDPGDAQRDRLPLLEVRRVPVDEPDARVEVVEDDHEREAGEPGGVRLPLEPVERLGHLHGREPVLLRVVEAASVHPPELACDARVRVLGVLRRAQAEVEPDEVEGGSDPRDPRGHVEHPQEDVEDVPQVRVHRSLAIATSSPAGRVELLLPAPPDPLPEHLEDLGLRAARHEDDEAEPELLLVDLVQVREIGEHDRVGVGPLLGGGPGRQPAPRADRRVGVERFDLLVVGERGDDVVGPPQRVLDLGEPFDEARASLEELRQLVRGQLPR